MIASKPHLTPTPSWLGEKKLANSFLKILQAYLATRASILMTNALSSILRHSKMKDIDIPEFAALVPGSKLDMTFASGNRWSSYVEADFLQWGQLTFLNC
jgi:uncharacterized membrane protein YfcA